MTENQGDRPEEIPTDAPTPSQAAAPTPSPEATAQPGLPPVPPLPQASRYPAPPTGYVAGATTAAAEPGSGQAFGATQPTLPIAGKPAGDRGAASSAGKVVALMVAAALVGGAAGLGGAAIGAGLWTTGTPQSASAPGVVTVNDAGSVNTTTAVASKVLPSSVTISASSGSSGGTGSGVVLRADGYVLTNTHVVTLDGATASPTLSVTTSDGRVYRATVVGTDPTYDLAVIKLEGATGLTPIEFGDSSALNVGDETIAVGAPLGLSSTVTTGIVSALNRSIEIASSAAPKTSEQNDEGGDEQFRFDFGQGQSQPKAPTSTIKIAVIQTDAAINPGNSGGALVDDRGRLIGINVAIATAGGSGAGSSAAGSIGVGFAVPSDIAKRISEELISTGTATHGLLGANVRNAATVEGSTITGAYIADVTGGGPAAAGGLKAGDTVTQFNGVPVSNAVDLTAQVRALAAGATAKVVYVRDGRTATTEVTLGSVQ